MDGSMYRTAACAAVLMAATAGCHKADGTSAPNGAASPVHIAQRESFPRCAGNPAYASCVALERKLASETEAEKKARIDRMEQERAAAMKAVADTPLADLAIRTPQVDLSGKPDVTRDTRERMTIEELHRRTLIGMEVYRRYNVGAAINGYAAASGDALCSVLRTYDGLCDARYDNVLITLDLGSELTAQVLYNHRGRGGAPICATVEMRPDGRVYLVGFLQNRC